jgi:hypothetical protein
MPQYLHDLLSMPIDPQTLRAILPSMGFANAMITFVITSVLQRPSLFRWRRFCWLTLVALWMGLVPVIADLVLPFSVLGFQNIGARFGILLWLFGMASLLIIVQRVFSVSVPAHRFREKADRCQMECDDSQEYVFGVPFMDQFLEECRVEKRRLYYPVLMIAERSTPGLDIAQRFFVRGLEEGEGGVYLTFTRPWSIIADQIQALSPPTSEELESNAFIIDCYSSQYMPHLKRTPRRSALTVEHCDPRDPLEVNRLFKKTLAAMRSRGIRQARAVYDSLSDFLAIADPELVVAYLRHSVVWEELSNVKSIYLLWPEVLSEPLNDKYLSWFSNTLLRLEKAEEGYLASIEHVLPSPRQLHIGETLAVLEASDEP